MRTPSEASAVPEFLPSRMLLKYRFLDGNCSLRSLSFLGFLDALTGFFSFLSFSFLSLSLYHFQLPQFFVSGSYTVSLVVRFHFILCFIV
jgi:hypothetical protein